MSLHTIASSPSNYFAPPIVSEWEKFKLLLWKNFYVQWNNRLQLVLVVLSPVFFCSFLVVLRFLSKVENTSATINSPIDIDFAWKTLVDQLKKRKKDMDSKIMNFTYNNFIPQLIVSYAPNTFEVFNNIMELAQGSLKEVQVTSFYECKHMREQMKTNFYIAGVCFDEAVMNDVHAESATHINGIYPQQLNYALVFPSELRIYETTYIGDTWKTNLLYDLLDNSLKRMTYQKDIGQDEYVSEGFISLQHYVSMSYIKLLPNDTKTKFPEIWMQQFPYPEHDYDVLVENIKITLPLMILFGFLYPVTYFTISMVWEKEKNLKVTMNISGLSNWIQFSAWFVNGVASMFVSTLMVLVLLKVHWNQRYAILTKSSFIAVLFLLFSYNVVSMCFCFMMSAFFRRTITTVIVIGLIWFITFVPFTVTVNDVVYSDLVDASRFLFSNTAMGLAFDLVLDFEQYANGLQWKCFIQSHPVGNKLTISGYIIVLYILSIVYVFIGFSVELIFIKSKNWFNFFRKNNNKRNLHSLIHSVKSRQSNFRMTKVFEVEPEIKHVTVEIKDLTKEYNGYPVVHEVSLNLYEDDITCLMGHNGSGKTTLISTIIGLISPTRGTATINNFDIRTENKFALERVGICLRDNVLFRDLTVENQIAFFSRMKGLSKAESEYEIHKYLEAMNLQNKRNILTKNLSNGLRQHLAVCCALAGDSKVVFLDEADSGMDVAARELLWQMLNREKRGRTILLTTHSTDESEALADRVAIMSGGQLTCHGTTYFLKKIYGHGYRLICNKNRDCDVNAVTEMVRKYIPNIVPECDIGSELSYGLEERYSEVFENLLNDLESNSRFLNLENCSISETTMADIFYKMGSEDPSDAERQRHSQILNGLTIHVEEYNHLKFFSDYMQLKGPHLWLSHWQAILFKRILYFIRFTRLGIYIQFLTPFAFAIMSFAMIKISRGPYDLRAMTFDMKQYLSTTTVVETGSQIDNESKIIDQRYRDILFTISDHHLEETNGETFWTYMMEKSLEDAANVNYRYPIGVTFGKEQIIAWFNNFPLHAAPLSLNMVHNAILQTVNTHAKINVKIHPLSYTSQHHATLMGMPVSLCNFLAFNLAVCISFLCTLPILYLVMERSMRFKLLQLISGVRLFILWMATFVYDFLINFIVAVSFLITIILFNHPNFQSYEISGWYFLALVLAGTSIVSYNYLLSSFFTEAETAYAFIASINLLGCVGFCASIDVLHMGYNEPLENANEFDVLFTFNPLYTLSHLLAKIFNIGEMQLICDDSVINIISTKLENCKAGPNCCVKYEIWDWNTGIIPEMLSLVVLGITSWILLCFIENRGVWHVRHLITGSSKYAETQEEYENRHVVDEDEITNERMKVIHLKPRDSSNVPLVVEDIAKFHGDQETINRLYLVIERGECFGLLGVNGNGKSTLFQVLVGDEETTFGRASVEGWDIQTNRFKMYQHIGYCPQNDVIPREYTGYELMKIFCLLRGIPRPMVREICENLAKVLGFFNYLYKLTGVYSTGCKKRLTFAFALLGTPTIVYLDDPTSCIDPSGRRQIWNIICKFRNKGKSVLIASFNPQECEIICDRLAVISKGRLQCIGSPWQLISKYTRGYLLKIKINNFVHTMYTKPVSTTTPVLKLASFVENEFTNSVLNDQHGNVLVFMIPIQNTSLARIFKKIARNAYDLNIEHFSITSANLSVVFVDITERQKELLRTSYF